MRDSGTSAKVPCLLWQKLPAADVLHLHPAHHPPRDHFQMLKFPEFVSNFDPQLITQPGTTASGQPISYLVAIHADSTPVTIDNPAKAGEIVTFLGAELTPAEPCP